MTPQTSPDLHAARPSTPGVLQRPLVGASLVGIAILHTAAAPGVYPDSLRSIWDGGVLDAVERDPSLIELRGLGFWYVTTGLAVGLLGGAARHLEHRPEGLPRWFGWGLLGLTAWGVALMPKSGFWAFAIPALLALRQQRQRGLPLPIDDSLTR
jgi:hypothetical protein